MARTGKGAERHMIRHRGDGYSCKKSGCMFRSPSLTGVGMHAAQTQYTVQEEWPPKMGLSWNKEREEYR